MFLNKINKIFLHLGISLWFALGKIYLFNIKICTLQNYRYSIPCITFFPVHAWEYRYLSPIYYTKFVFEGQYYNSNGKMSDGYRIRRQIIRLSFFPFYIIYYYYLRPAAVPFISHLDNIFHTHACVNHTIVIILYTFAKTCAVYLLWIGELCSVHFLHFQRRLV